MGDQRPVVMCVVAWWSDRKATPIVQPRGDTKAPDGKRHIRNAAFTLEQAAHFADLGFEIIPDPFDLEALARWEQLNKPQPKPRGFFRRGDE
jgi:hypothetical protein